MDLKQHTITPLIPIFRAAYQFRGYRSTYGNRGWYKDRAVRDFLKKFPNTPAKSVEDFFDWIVNSQVDAELYLAQRSPSTAAKLAVQYKSRLDQEAETIIIEKAKDRSTLLEYCSHFGILLPEMAKVTFKAAFDKDARREKKYIQKIEETKKNLRGFLVQLININQVDPNLTVKELVDSL